MIILHRRYYDITIYIFNITIYDNIVIKFFIPQFNLKTSG